LRYCCTLVARRPARPKRSIECCQPRNPHRQRVAAQASSRLSRPPRTRRPLRLAADHPTAGRDRRQIGERQRAPIGADDIAHACLRSSIITRLQNPRPAAKNNLRAFKKRPRAVVNEPLKPSRECARKALISGLFARSYGFSSGRNLLHDCSI